MLLGLCFVLSACNIQQVKEPDSITGKWKIYKTNIGGRDISKSSDPTNENGIEFRADGTFYSFGNPGHRDEGVYYMEEEGVLTFESIKKKNVISKALVEINEDSLQLSFQLNQGKLLNISLYKMSSQ